MRIFVHSPSSTADATEVAVWREGCKVQRFVVGSAVQSYETDTTVEALQKQQDHTFLPPTPYFVELPI
jgi:hypothetical protein